MKLNENKSESNFKALEFFKIFQKELPTLAQVVKIIFSVTATSVPSESLFSDAGQIQSDARNRLRLC